MGRVGVSLALGLFCWLAVGGVGRAQVPADLEQLLEAARGAHAALDHASEAVQGPLRDYALSADGDAASAADAFLGSAAFSDLPADQQASLLAERFELEARRTRLLVERGRCAEARDQAQALLASDYDAPDGRADLNAALQGALACAPGTLRIQAFPENAEVWIDGEQAGAATDAFELPVGTHTVSLRAAGLTSSDAQVEVTEPGQVVALGPIYLRQESPPEDRTALPRWDEWTLWGVGAVAVGVGVGYLLGARDIRDQLALAFRFNPNHQFQSEQEDEAQNKDLVGYITGGVGVALIGVGTWLYVVRQIHKRVPAGAVDRSPRWDEWGLWVLGAAGLTYAATLFTQAAHRNGYADDLASELGHDTSGVEGLHNEADDLRTRGALIATAGAVCAVLGTALYAIRTSGDGVEDGSAPASPEVGLVLPSGDAGLWLRLRF